MFHVSPLSSVQNMYHHDEITFYAVSLFPFTRDTAYICPLKPPLIKGEKDSTLTFHLNRDRKPPQPFDLRSGGCVVVPPVCAFERQRPFHPLLLPGSGTKLQLDIDIF